MALDIPSRLSSILRLKSAEKLMKKGRDAKAHSREDRGGGRKDQRYYVRTEKKWEETGRPETFKGVEATKDSGKVIFNEQWQSPFFKYLPLEIRKMIYAYVWPGPYDHMYHEPRGRHLHFQDGHWVHTRCVMFQEDEGHTDFIQAQMDMISHSGQGNLLLWQRRLASTWGQRHWRCEERVLYGEPTAIDRTDLGALMVVCKKMHPEVMRSFVECHKLMFNDLYSAYRFLVQQHTSHLIPSIRALDLTLSVPFHELVSFVPIGSWDSGHDGLEEGTTTIHHRSHLGAVLEALADGITCLNSLRVAFDVYDKGPWRKIPETALAPYLERLRVRKSRTGELNYTVELPAALPIQRHYAGMQDLEDDGDGDGKAPGARAFRVARRRPLRYWQFSPGEVDHFTWETHRGEEERQHCSISLTKATRHIDVSNPYLADFARRW
ncbi:hypothetical protein F5Y17DRAFT_271515 [Xylariaceae sp. FL0594]|nr:hypothetical protein F5Y17DRAFT_271515 [Xylariaceae sp. FL0594]